MSNPEEIDRVERQICEISDDRAQLVLKKTEMTKKLATLHNRKKVAGHPRKLQSIECRLVVLKRDMLDIEYRIVTKNREAVQLQQELDDLKKVSYATVVQALADVIDGAEQEYSLKDEGNAPGHCHRVPGHWDDTGEPCCLCRRWNNAKAVLARATATT